MTQTAVAEINIQALKENFQHIQQCMPNQKILPMIKGNAYGHGLISVAKALPQASAFGVANLYEAMQLRESGIHHDIVVMRGFCNEEEWQAFANDERLIAGVHDKQQIALLKSLSLRVNSPIRAWLKIDTGMHRLGFLTDDFHSLFYELVSLKNIIRELSVFSHLADSDNSESPFTMHQIDQFAKITENIQVKKSLLNSAGIIAYPQTAYDWIRPGILLYGASPFPMNSLHHHATRALSPVMTLRSQIIATKTVSAGESIGYSCTYQADKEMRIAIVGIGYADGYPRHAKSGTPVWISGKRCPLVGRVSMDMIAVDVSMLPSVVVGDEVILWGKNLRIEEIAACTDSIPHELLTRVTARVQTVYIA